MYSTTMSIIFFLSENIFYFFSSINKAWIFNGKVNIDGTFENQHLKTHNSFQNRREKLTKN